MHPTLSSRPDDSEERKRLVLSQHTTEITRISFLVNVSITPILVYKVKVVCACGARQISASYDIEDIEAARLYEIGARKWIAFHHNLVERGLA